MEFDQIETIQQEIESHCMAQPLFHDHQVVISIEEKIGELPPVAEECCIYRVPKRLFNMNPPAYTPQIISIGPFHHGKENLVDMERHKLRFLDCYLHRTNMCVKDVFEIARTWEERARRCYAEPINMKSDKFVEMMLVDACFIVEYLITFFWYGPIETEIRLDTKHYCGIMSDMYRDLTMLENQLPFFVLQYLFDKLPNHEENHLSLLHLAHAFLSYGFLKTCEFHRLDMISTHEVKHLVDLLSFNLVPLSSTENSESENLEPMLPPIVTELCVACVKIPPALTELCCVTCTACVKIPSAVTELCCVACVKIKKPTEDNMENRYPPPVTELRDAGVKIKRAAKGKSLIDISFKDGVLEIPHFEIDDCYETAVRNMMAYEHYDVQNDRKYAIQYISFLDDLISTKEDVRILVKEGIITNSIGGSNKEVANLFNDLCKEVILPIDPWHLDHISQDLRNHCKKLCNNWMASLRRNYLGTPWATISIFAAMSLLILTFLQTLFSAPSLKSK